MVDGLLRRGVGAVQVQIERIMGAGFDPPDPVMPPGQAFGPMPTVGGGFGAPPQVGADPWQSSGIQVREQPFGVPQLGQGNPFGTLAPTGGNPFGVGPTGVYDPFGSIPRAPSTSIPTSAPGVTTPYPTGANSGAGGASAWVQSVAPASSPIIPIADQIAQYAIQRGVDPALIFGKLQAESTWATRGQGPGMNNPGNIMAPGADPANGVIILRQYGSMLEGVRAMVDLLASYHQQYGPMFGKTQLSTEDLVAIYYVGPEAYRKYGLQANDAGGYGPGGNGTVQDYLNRHVYPVIESYNRRPGAQLAGGPVGNAGALEQVAQPLLGNPYQLGGRRANGKVGPGIGIDCSEFTAYLYESQGVNLTWNAWAQFNETQRVERGQWQPGDLIFFQGTSNTDGSPVSHVGMFVGYDAQGRPTMLHSGSNGVEYADLSNQYWTSHYFGAGRVTR